MRYISMRRKKTWVFFYLPTGDRMMLCFLPDSDRAKTRRRQIGEMFNKERKKGLWKMDSSVF